MNQKVLVISGVSWDSTHQRHHKVVEFLDRNGYQVDFISNVKSSSVFSLSKIMSKISNKFFNQRSSSTNTKPSDKFLEIKSFNLPYKTIINKLFLLIVKKKLRFADYDIVIYYIPCQFTHLLLNSVSTKRVIYDCVRNFSGWDNITKSVVKYERLLLQQVDRVLVDSYYLKDKLSVVHSDVHQILPSVYTQCFHSKVTGRLNKFAFFGTVSNHFDESVLGVLSKCNVELFIWGVDELGLSDKYDFIKFKGYIDNECQLLTEIHQTCDAIIIPYKGSMDGVIPAKLMQSLSTGLPVFVSSFYDSRYLNDFLYVYSNQQDLEDSILNFSIKEHIMVAKRSKSFSLENSADKFNENLKKSLLL